MKRSIIVLLFLAALYSHAQDLAFGRQMVDTLASPFFWGRGYTNDGMGKAADFLAAQFESYGLKPMKGRSFLQAFSYSVNTFPGKVELNLNGTKLEPGRDFIVSPESRGVKGRGNLEQTEPSQFVNRDLRVIVKLEDKLTWSVSQQAADYTVVLVDKKSVTLPLTSIELNIENKFVEKFKISNVCGIVKGT